MITILTLLMGLAGLGLLIFQGILGPGLSIIVGGTLAGGSLLFLTLQYYLLLEGPRKGDVLAAVRFVLAYVFALAVSAGISYAITTKAEQAAPTAPSALEQPAR